MKTFIAISLLHIVLCQNHSIQVGYRTTGEKNGIATICQECIQCFSAIQMLISYNFFFFPPCKHPDNFKKQEIRKAIKNAGIQNTGRICRQQNLQA